jgi:hypothetical protein
MQSLIRFETSWISFANTFIHRKDAQDAKKFLS